MTDVEVKFVLDLLEAQSLAKQGFEPVECSFGNESVVGPLKLDHHGELSSEEPVSLKATKLAQEGIRRNRFVVTGTPDADQIYAILALSGQVTPDLDLARSIAEIDLDPINHSRLEPKYLRIVIFFQVLDHSAKMIQSQEAVEKALLIGKRIFDTSKEIDPKIAEKAREEELARLAEVSKTVKAIIPDKVVLAEADFWTMDGLSQIAEAIVAFMPKLGRITVGLKRHNGFGRYGLKMVYPYLSKFIHPGWGGRELIGGSPRGIRMDTEDAISTFQILASFLGC